MGLDEKDILSRFQENDAFFQSLINTIPAKVYFDKDMQDYLEEEKKKSSEFSLEGIQMKNLLSVKGKQVRARLNPAQIKTVSQIHEELLSNSQTETKTILESKRPLRRAKNIENLQRKLKSKIKEMQKNRKATKTDRNVLKIQRKANKVKKSKNIKKIKLHGEMKSMPSTGKVIVPVEIPTTVFNKEAKLVYSKIEIVEKGSTAPKPNASGGTLSSLNKAKQAEEKIKILETDNPNKAAIVKQKNLWKKVLSMTEGVKVKDDPTLLKKSVKRREKEKKQSKKKWDERLQHVQQKKKDQQEKRRRNLQQRKKAKAEKKVKKFIKKGHILPGF